MEKTTSYYNFFFGNSADCFTFWRHPLHKTNQLSENKRRKKEFFHFDFHFDFHFEIQTKAETLSPNETNFFIFFFCKEIKMLKGV